MLFSFMLVSDIGATELTEEITTEEVTEENSLTLPEINQETVDQAKTWVVGALISLLAVMTSSTVIGIILNKLATKALKEVDKAVENNAISQKQADQAVNLINDSNRKAQEQLNKFFDDVGTKIDSFTEKFDNLDDKVGKITTILDNFAEALDEYLKDDEEV